MSQTDMNICQAQLKSKAFKELDEAVSAYKQRLTPEQTKAFDKAQVAWTVYRDESCAFQSSGVEGGSAYPMVLTQGIESKAKQRLSEVKYLAECQEGDLSYPAW